MSPGKMIRILSGLRRKPGRGHPFLDLSPGDGGRRSPVGCLLLLEAPAVRLAAKRLRRRKDSCGSRTGVPGQLPASIGSACCPPGRRAASAAGGCRCHKSLRLPCVKGAGARRATDGLSAETFAERIIPVRPFYPLLSRWVRELKFVPPNAFLPPFRGHLPGGGKAPSSNLPGCSRHGTPTFRPCRRLEMQYGKHHDKRTGPGADPEHRQE